MGQSVKILYVDDEPFLQMAFVEGIKKGGYDVIGSMGGESVFDLVQNEQPDILILDIMMKPLDGWSILLTIKDYPTFENMSVIMQSGKSLNLRDFGIYAPFIDDYLIKPIRISDILSSIQQIVIRDEEIATDVKRATDIGIEKARIQEYAQVKREVTVLKNLIRSLARLYPILNHGTETLTHLDNPELAAILNEHTTNVAIYEALKHEMFG